jgi:hypothetical protein
MKNVRMLYVVAVSMWLHICARYLTFLSLYEHLVVGINCSEVGAKYGGSRIQKLIHKSFLYKDKTKNY